MSVIRVMIVDDHAVARRSLYALLKMAPEIELVGEARNGQEAIACVPTFQPDLILMDLSMPRMDGLTATEQIRAMDNPPRVLVVSMYADTPSVIRAFRLGAQGILLKTHPPEELLSAIHQVMDGHKVLSAELKSLPRLMQFLDPGVHSIPN